MQSETLAYKLQPAGHEEQKPKRKITEPDKRLANAFEEWLNSGPISSVSRLAHGQASYLLKNLTPSVDDVIALLLAYQDHPKIEDAGLFIMAIYNNMKQKEIVHNAKIEKLLDWMGYNLCEDKILVNLSDLARLGEKSKGTIINYGNIAVSFGHTSIHCFSINYGTCQSFGSYCQESIHLNLGKVAYSPGPSNWNTFFINLGEWGVLKTPFITYIKESRRGGQIEVDQDGLEKAPALRDYVEELKNTFEPGRTDYKLALKALKTYTRETLESNIKALLEGKHE